MQADFSLDYDVLTVERPQKLYMMARFVAGDAPGERGRRPLNLSLVIDRSGSMAGDKIDYTKQAAQFLVQHLSNKDTLSIVLYNDKVETLVAPEVISNKDMVTQLIERIRVRGTTNLSGGWLEGCRHVKASLRDNTLNRVLLMSDGLANRGVTDMNTLVTMARQKREEGVSTTTMGLGNDFNEDLMIEMASAGGGAFYFIESPEVAPIIFQEELSGLLNVVGQNLTITMLPTDHISMINQLNAYPVHTTGNTTAFSLGDIFANEEKTLVLEMSVPALDTLGEIQIATLIFDYDEIDGANTRHQRKEVAVMVNVQPQQEPVPIPDPQVTHSVLLLKAAQARQNAVKAADRGNYQEATEFLRSVADEMESVDLEKVPELKEEHDALLEQANRLKQGAAAYDQYSRKTMSTQAFYTMTNRHDDTVMLRMREGAREGQIDQPAQVEDQDKPTAKDENHITMSTPVPKIEDEEDPTVKRQPGVPPTQVRWKNAVFALTGDLMRIGRSSHNEIVINERGVSRFHGQIRREGDKLLLEDLGSTNGTRINGKVLVEAFELSVGDIVHLCDEKLVFIDGKA